MSSTESGSDWEEEDIQLELPCLCLFCSREFENGAQAVLEHCSAEHDYDLMGFVKEKGVDFYSCIKLINYIRKENPHPAEIQSAVRPFPWEQDVYLAPVIADDPLLQLDYEPSDTPQSGASKPADETVITDGNVEERLRELESEVEFYKQALARAEQGLEAMKSVVQAVLTDSDHPTTSTNLHTDLDSDSYFHSYAHHSIHEDMLKDTVRTESYRAFIEGNTALFKDKVVLDVGCGTGVLSMFAAKAGARRVFGVDQSSIVYKAMDIVRENGLEGVVTVIKGKVEEISLPVDSVDIIISEWMGYFLLFESMLDTVLFARDKWLKDPTKVFPNTCSISLVALGDKDDWADKIQFWEDVYGLKMSCMKQEVLSEASVRVVDPYSTISSTDTVKKFDLSTTQVTDLEFEGPFELTMQSDTACYAFAGYFDVGFEAEVSHLVHMSTSPQDDPTHWKQTVFYLEQPFKVHTGDLLKGSIKCSKLKSDPRSLEVIISYELHSFLVDSPPVKSKQTYFLR